MSERRKRLGAWYTPADLVEAVVGGVVDAGWLASRSSTAVRVLDPACGDGRFLAAAAQRITELGRPVELVGVDVDPDAVSRARAALPGASIVEGDALAHAWDGAGFDLVIGNPPYLSQLARGTTRGGAGSRGVGTYGDVAAEFLALGADLADPSGGRLAMVLPQSILASRDAADVRRAIDARATLVWSWWSAVPVFEAQVLTCALAFELGAPTGGAPAVGPGNWARVVTDRQRIPPVPALDTDGTLGDRATLNANFRDQYYGLVGAVVGDTADELPDPFHDPLDDGRPPLITSGLIDPGRSRWAERPITFHRQRIHRPRVDLAALDDAMRRWARRRLVPKVLVANQTAIIEALADPAGAWLPGVPVIGVYPTGCHWDDRPSLETPLPDAADLERSVWEIAAVLTSPVASVSLWHERAGTGLSAGAVRVAPATLAALPWPRGTLDDAVAALRAGDVRACGLAIDRAYGVTGPAATELADWWTAHLGRIEARRDA